MFPLNKGIVLIICNLHWIIYSSPVPPLNNQKYKSVQKNFRHYVKNQLWIVCVCSNESILITANKKRIFF